MIVYLTIHASSGVESQVLAMHRISLRYCGSLHIVINEQSGRITTFLNCVNQPTTKRNNLQFVPAVLAGLQHQPPGLVKQNENVNHRSEDTCAAAATGSLQVNGVERSPMPTTEGNQ